MNEKLEKAREVWVKALRSGAFVQGKGRLKSNKGKYCCLGVLEHIATQGNFDGGQCSVSEQARALVGLQNSYGSYKDARRQTNSLTSINDNGKSFDEIADLIESKPEGLFVD